MERGWGQQARAKECGWWEKVIKEREEKVERKVKSEHTGKRV